MTVGESLPPPDALLEPRLQGLVERLGTEVFSGPGARLPLMSACVDFFSDGELRVKFDEQLPPDSPMRPWLVGESRLFWREMDGLAEQDPGYMLGLERDIANAAAENTQLPESPSKLLPLVDVDVDSNGQWQLHLGEDAKHPLPNPPRLVIDYGPGVRGTTFVDRHLQLREQGVEPFTYLGVAQGNFVPLFLQRYLQLRLSEGRGQEATMEELQQYLNGTFALQNEGIAAFTSYLANGLGGQGVADVVLCSGMQTADPAEIEAGIANAHALLKEGGALVVRVPCPPDDPNSRRAAFFRMLETAYAGGFDMEQTHRYGSAAPGLLPDGSHRGYLCAVLVKN